MKKITPFLWFDQDAEAAVELYRSLFDDVKVHGITRYPEGSPSPGTVITIDFEIAGQEVIALNGGPMYQFTEAFSFSVRADSQAEIDRLWEGLTANGGEPGPCGWLKDRFGLSWQVSPKKMADIITGPDPEKADRAMRAMLTMKKIVLADIEEAVRG